METILFYDVATTGLVNWKRPSNDKSQPHVVALSALLVRADGEAMTELNFIVKPDGWASDPGAEAVHGVSHERAMAEGIPEAEALVAFYNLWQEATTRASFGEAFDARVIRIGLKRYGGRDPEGHNRADRWKAGTGWCVQKLAGDIMQLPAPPGSRFKHKSPTLEEAARCFVGLEHESRTSTRVNALMACRIWCAIQNKADR